MSELVNQAKAAVDACEGKGSLDSDAIVRAVQELPADSSHLSLGRRLVGLGYASLAGWIAEQHLLHDKTSIEANLLAANALVSLTMHKKGEEGDLGQAARHIETILEQEPDHEVALAAKHAIIALVENPQLVGSDAIAYDAKTKQPASIVACSSCGAKNRISSKGPSNRRPVCGRCKSGLG